MQPESTRSDCNLMVLDKDSLNAGWSAELFQPVGCLGTVVKYILDHSPTPEPKFALAASLILFCGILGGAVRDITGQRTNIYVLCSGPSCAGKDKPYKLVQKILDLLGLTKLRIGQFSSDSAIQNSLKDFPTRIIFLDEVGEFLGGIKPRGGAPQHIRQIMPMIKQLWSGSDDDYMCKSRATNNKGDWEERVIIEQPCVSIYGTGAPNRLYSSISESEFEDGALPRFLIFHAKDEFPCYHELSEDRGDQDHLIAELRSFMDAFGIKSLDQNSGSTPSRLERPRVKTVPQTAAATRVFANIENERRAYWYKAKEDPIYYTALKNGEHARRIALIHACSRNPSNPEVDECDAEYAAKLVSAITSENIRNLQDNYASTKQEMRQKKLIQIIKAAGDTGISTSEITRKARGRLFADILGKRDALNELTISGVIEEFAMPGSGSKHIHGYRYIADEAE